MPARPRRKDEAERKKLQAIPTGLTIDLAGTALLVAAGEEFLRSRGLSRQSEMRNPRRLSPTRALA